MNPDVLAIGQTSLRGTDSNSLLRLYDLATDIFQKSASQLERAKAGKVAERIAKELRRRKATL